MVTSGSSIHATDSRIGIVNKLMKWGLAFCEALGLVVLVALIISISIYGLQYIFLWSVISSVLVLAISVITLILNMMWSYRLQLDRHAFQSEVDEVQDKERALEAEKERLKLEWERVKLAQQEQRMRATYAQGVQLEKEVPDFDVFTDENGTTQTTTAESTEYIVDYGKLYLQLKEQARLEQSGGNHWGIEKWKSYTRSPYQKVRINGKKGAIKFLAFEHIKWREANPIQVIYKPESPSPIVKMTAT